MKTPARKTLFLERASYRRKRLADAALLLPVLAAVLFLWPLVLPSEDGGVATRRAAVYFFGLWFALVGLAALMARALSRGDAGPAPGPGAGPGPGAE
jgi:hypothetical protein